MHTFRVRKSDWLKHFDQAHVCSPLECNNHEAHWPEVRDRYVHVLNVWHGWCYGCDHTYLQTDEAIEYINQALQKGMKLSEIINEDELRLSSSGANRESSEGQHSPFVLLRERTTAERREFVGRGIEDGPGVLADGQGMRQGLFPGVL